MEEIKWSKLRGLASGLMNVHMGVQSWALSTDPASPAYNDPAECGISLTITNFKEHIRKCSTVNDGNILIHKSNTIRSEVQDDIYNRLFIDTLLKGAFKQYIKYIVRAFSSVDRFIEFIDMFYSHYHLITDFDTMKVSLLFDENMIFDLFRDYVHENPYHFDFNDYLYDLIEFFITMAKLKNEIVSEPETDAEGLYEKRPALAQNCGVVLLNYDIYTAYDKLASDMTFVEPERLFEEKAYLMHRVNGKAAIYEINDSLYQLLSNIKDNESSTCKDILKKTADMYTHDAKELNFIIEDLTQTIYNLVNQGSIILT